MSINTKSSAVHTFNSDSHKITSRFPIMKQCYLKVFQLIFALLIPSLIHAETDEILLGQSTALSGPIKELGIGMRAGLNAAFSEVNDNGGIRGRKIRLISLDDGYEPDRAIKNTRKLIEEDKVLLLIGEVGTPTSKAVLPLINKAKIPYLGPYTGAEFLRNPVEPYVINFRGSYHQEMERLVEYLVERKKFTRIACFYQNDSFGRSGLRGAEIALEKRGMKLIGNATYERNTLAVKSGALKIKKLKAQAVIIVATNKACVKFIKTMKMLGAKETVLCTMSIVATKILAQELGSDGDGCIISQVTTHYENTDIEVIKNYHAAMDKYQPNSLKGYVTLEGYLLGKLFCHVANEVDRKLTGDNFIQKLEEIGNIDLGGMELTFSKTDHQGMDEVFLTTLRNGKVQPI